MTVSGVWMGSFGPGCVIAIDSLSVLDERILCSLNQKNELLLRIPANVLQPRNAGSVITLTDLASNVYSSSSSMSQLTIVNDFFVSSVKNSLIDSFIEVTGSEFGDSAAVVSATVLFSMMRVLQITRGVVTLSGSGSEFDVGDTVRFSGTSLASNLLSDVLYIVSSKPTPTSITLQTMDGAAVTNLGAAADISSIFMSVVSPCTVNPRAFTSSAFSCMHTPLLSRQAQLVVGITLELSVLGVVKTFTFPDFKIMPAAAQSLAAPNVSFVSAAQRVASPQSITVLGSNFGVNAAAVAVDVSMPSRCDRQFVATAAQARPAPIAGFLAGSAIVTFTQLSFTSVSVSVVATDLTSDLTGVYIYLLPIITDPTGSVVFALCGASPPCPTGTSPTVTATWNTASGLTSAILNGLFSASNIGLYANLHTVNNKDGELRANINPALSSILCKAFVDSEISVASVKVFLGLQL